MSLTEDKLRSVDWQSVIADVEHKSISNYVKPLFERADEARGEGNIDAVEVLSTLGGIASMRLVLDAMGEPFRPIARFNNGSHSFALENLEDGDLAALEAVLDSITDAEMKARVGDILWVTKKKYKAAQAAVEAYLESAKALEDPEAWSIPHHRIARALELALSLGRSSPLKTTVLAYIEELLVRLNGNDPLYFSAKLMDLLQEQRTGDPVMYAPLAEKAAQDAEQKHEWERARTYWRVHSTWMQIAGWPSKAEDSLVHLAETHFNQAEDALNTAEPNFLLASTNLHQAIEAYRRIGYARAGVKERVDELHAQMMQHQKSSLTQLKKVTASQSLDFSAIEAAARNAVAGKSLLEALFNLAHMVQPMPVSALKKRVEQNAKDYPLQFLFGSGMINSEGKVIGRRPSLTAEDEEERATALKSEMLQVAQIDQAVNVVSVIEPARQQILSEHSVSYRDLLPLVLNNPFVPPGRELIYAQGLLAGLEGNLLIAIHLLIPQVENSFRSVLSRRGVIVSNLDKYGIQDEFDINRILDMKEFQDVFGEDLTFYIKGLLVERFGANIRNNMAHGLLSFDDYLTNQMLYTWWLVLHMCLAHSTEPEES